MKRQIPRLVDRLKKVYSQLPLPIRIVQQPGCQTLEEACQQVGRHQMQSVLKKAEKIKVTAAAVQAVSLSSNQVGISGAYFVIATTLHPDKWINPNLKPSAYKLYVNPEIIESSKLEEYGYEECPSTPGLAVRMKRPDTITVKYRNEKFEAVKEQLVGFEARVFHHEFNHLMGKTIMSYEENQGETEVLSEARNELYLKELDLFKTYVIMGGDQNIQFNPLSPESMERYHKLKASLQKGDSEETKKKQKSSLSSSKLTLVQNKLKNNKNAAKGLSKRKQLSK